MFGLYLKICEKFERMYVATPQSVKLDGRFCFYFKIGALSL